MDNFPDFIIAGSAKAGTTALHLMLDQHPQIAMSTTKETNYFVHAYEQTNHYVGHLGERVFEGLDDSDRIDTHEKYSGLFQNPSGRAMVLGESSPLYMISPDVPQRILAHNPDTKIIFSLRNPTDVAFANFVHLVRDGAESLGLNQMDEMFDASRYDREHLYPFCCHLDLPRYASHLPVWLDTFSRDRIYLLVYEEFNANRRECLSKLFEFLAVSNAVRINVHREVNVSGMPRSKTIRKLIQGSEGLKSILRGIVPTRPRRRMRQLIERLNTGKRVHMPPHIRRRLDEMYINDVSYIESLLGREIPSWRRLRCYD